MTDYTKVSKKQRAYKKHANNLVIFLCSSLRASPFSPGNALGCFDIRLQSSLLSRIAFLNLPGVFGRHKEKFQRHRQLQERTKTAR